MPNELYIFKLKIKSKSSVILLFLKTIPSSLACPKETSLHTMPVLCLLVTSTWNENTSSKDT